MEKQRWEESQKKRAEERRSRKRKSQKKEDPGARKGSKVAKHCVFPMICGSAGSKSRLAKAAGAEPSGQMRDEKLQVVVTRSTFPSQNVQNTPGSEHFWKLSCRKSARRCGAKHISKSKVLKTDGLGALLDVQMWFCVAGARDCAPCQKWAKREGFLASPKTMAGVGHLKRIWKDAFSVAGAVRETCSSEMLGGQGADFLRGVAFWSIRSSVSERWFCVTGAALCMTWHHFFVAGAILQRHGLEKLQKALVRGRPAFNFHYWRKSRRIASFLTLSSSKVEEVSQNCFVFNLADCG